MLRVTYELGKEALDVCLRRNRRASQAFPGGGGRSGWRGARQPERDQRRGAGPVGDRRAAGGHPGRVRGRVRLGVAAGAAGRLRLRAAHGAPAAMQGDRLGTAEERQGRRGEPGTAAARRPAPGGVDRAAGGAAAAGAAAAPGAAGPAADAAAQPDPRGPGRPRAGPPGRVLERPGPGLARRVELPAVSREVIEDDLALIDAIQVPIDRLDWEVRQRGRSDPRVKVLTQLPGVGPFTAMVILAEVGDVSRFGSARKLAAWAGLTPTVRGSDRVAHYGHISKQGSVLLRWALCEAAQTAKRSPQFAATFQAIAKRRGKMIATTAVARKLLNRAWHLLTDAGHAIPPPAAAPTAPERTR